MQRNDSILLSHSGLRYYLKTDKKIYKELLQKHLPTKWIDANKEMYNLETDPYETNNLLNGVLDSTQQEIEETLENEVVQIRN